MKHYFFLGFILTMLTSRQHTATGQVLWAEIGVNGLTCSQCCKTVEQSIRKLDFVMAVKMDLEQTSGLVNFKEGSDIDPELLADAVSRAGFSVRYLKAQMLFDSITISDEYCHWMNGRYFQFIHSAGKKLKGQVVVKFEGKKYMPVKEYRKVRLLLRAKCATAGEKGYFVSVL